MTTALRSGGTAKDGETTFGRSRAWEWLVRYGPAEAAAILGLVVGAGAMHPFGLTALTAYGGSIGSSVAFYAVLLVRDLRRHRPGRDPKSVRHTLRGLVLEFGPAELLDCIIVRPLAIYAGAIVLGNLTAGIILGKIAADIIFYAIAITGYELGKALPH